MSTPNSQPSDDTERNGLSIGLALLVIAIIVVMIWAVKKWQPAFVADFAVRNMSTRRYMERDPGATRSSHARRYPEERAARAIQRMQRKCLDEEGLGMFPVVKYRLGIGERMERGRGGLEDYEEMGYGNGKDGGSGDVEKSGCEDVASKASRSSSLPLSCELNHMPTSSHDLNGSSGDEATETATQPTHQPPPICSICTEPFLEQQNIRILPCNHIYHRHCIDRWVLGFAGTCPMCRSTLQPSTTPPTPTACPQPPSSHRTTSSALLPTPPPPTYTPAVQSPHSSTWRVTVMRPASRI